MTDWSKSYRILPEPVTKHEFVPYKADDDHSTLEIFHNRDILIDTLHDGDIIPACFWDALSEDQELRDKQIEEINAHYALERDWGANDVSEALVNSLNAMGYQCPGYFRVNIARVLMDYGRFPGNTPADAAHLDRFAINYPFSHILEYEHKKHLLENYYDDISDSFERIVSNKKLKIAVHTYDRYNKTGTERPLMSILTRPLGYQTSSTIPYDFFDPLYPAKLCETTADRKLTYRLSLMLEKAGFEIAHNYPYNLPDGSIEVRSQVWFFFQHLRQHFQEANPQTTDEHAYQSVWRMLLDTNLRSTDSENLRSYLHMFRKAPPGEEKIYRDAHEAYRHIRNFMQKDDSRIVHEYRESPHRPSSIGIEVRKDYLWDFADKSCHIPLGPKAENAHKVGEILAQALMIYMKADAEVKIR